MNEMQKTLTYGGVAILIGLSALLTTPASITPDTFLDQGEPFFPEFTDPNIATTLEVIEFDEDTAAARPFKVTFQNGRWTIPSHHDYPADGKDQLAKTAAGVMEIKKDEYRSNNVSDYEAFGVIDPLDETITTLKGRGKRVTIKGESGQVLADLILGSAVEGRSNLRFVRLPDQKRVYAARVDLEISTKFEDWIDRDLLQLERRDINQVTLNDYSINEATRSVDQRGVLVLKKTQDTWKANRMSSNQEVNSNKMDDLLGAIDDLSIVGVRPKPQGLSANLARARQGQGVSQADALSLQSKGYYFTRNGKLLSNEGEMEVRTGKGIIYTLRFGEVLYGTGEAVTAGTSLSDDKKSGPGENRYLFITVSFNPAQIPEPDQPGDTSFLTKAEEDWNDNDRQQKKLKDQHDQWQENITKEQELSDQQNARFANWYYVISSSSFDKIHLKRDDLVTKKKS